MHTYKSLKNTQIRALLIQVSYPSCQAESPVSGVLDYCFHKKNLVINLMTWKTSWGHHSDCVIGLQFWGLISYSGHYRCVVFCFHLFTYNLQITQLETVLKIWGFHWIMWLTNTAFKIVSCFLAEEKPLDQKIHLSRSAFCFPHWPTRDPQEATNNV